MGLMNVRLFDPQRSEFWILFEAILALLGLVAAKQWAPGILSVTIPLPVEIPMLGQTPTLENLLGAFVGFAVLYALARLQSKEKELNPAKIAGQAKAAIAKK